MNIKIGDLVWTKYAYLPIGLVLEIQQASASLLFASEDNPPYYRLLLGEDPGPVWFGRGEIVRIESPSKS